MGPLDRLPPLAAPVAAPMSAADRALMDTARRLEATFLSEMLKSAGFGAAREALGGGAGEDQFASFLRAEHARAIVDRGGLGLSESIFNALKDRRDGA